MKRLDAEWITNNLDTATDNDKLAAGKHWRQYLRGQISGGENLANVLGNAGQLSEVTVMMLSELDIMHDNVTACQRMFPMIDGWDEIENRLAALHEQIRAV